MGPQCVSYSLLHVCNESVFYDNGLNADRLRINCGSPVANNGHMRLPNGLTVDFTVRLHPAGISNIFDIFSQPKGLLKSVDQGEGLDTDLNSHS